MFQIFPAYEMSQFPKDYAFKKDSFKMDSYMKEKLQFQFSVLLRVLSWRSQVTDLLQGCILTTFLVWKTR